MNDCKIHTLITVNSIDQIVLHSNSFFNAQIYTNRTMLVPDIHKIWITQK